MFYPCHRIPNPVLTKFLKMQPSIRSFFKPKSTGNTTPTKATSKRPAEDDSDDSDAKRLAVTSDGATPVKEARKDSTASISTPVKRVQDDDVKKMPPSSPLVDIKTVIQKKIASGLHALHENIGPSWFRALQAEFDKPYFKKLSDFVQQERKTKAVFPPEHQVYSWTHHHDIRATRVIILGQDPYHGPGQAHGLSFSVQKGVRLPPSLINIFKELESDIQGFKNPGDGDLTGWARQGVLMLNTCLTVNKGQAFSHQSKGWETFTDSVISYISKNSPSKVVFLLWGKPAQRKANLITSRHEILKAAHPSPLSAHNGFFGCKHFSKTNNFLRSQGLPEIDWRAL